MTKAFRPRFINRGCDNSFRRAVGINESQLGLRCCEHRSDPLNARTLATADEQPYRLRKAQLPGHHLIYELAPKGGGHVKRSDIRFTATLQKFSSSECEEISMQHHCSATQ